jgi:isoleucyl-tRNA synthetase
MDKTGLRKDALASSRTCKFYPEWRNRIGSMVEGTSRLVHLRQRNWGVPIPAFTCEDCGETVMNDDTLDAVIELFREKGSDAWFTDRPQGYPGRRLLPQVRKPRPEGQHRHPRRLVGLRRLPHRRLQAPRLPAVPADMYLEGSDQHRGWFRARS